MDEFKLPMDLQYFAEGGEGGDGGPGSDPAPTPATPPAPLNGGNGVDVGKLQADARGELLKSLGVENEDDLQSIVKSHKEQKAANQSELESAKDNLDKTSTKLDKANQRAEDAESQLSAFKKGVSNDHLTDVLVLAKAEINGKQAKDIDGAIDQVLERNPQFKAEPASDKTAIVDHNISGGDAGKAPLLDTDKLNQFRITK